MWPQYHGSPATHSEPYDPMARLGNDMQRLGIGSQSPRPVRPQSADLQVQHRPSTPYWTHAHPEPPTTPRAPRVRLIDGSEPLSVSNFQTGRWDNTYTGNAQITRQDFALPPTPQETSAVGSGTSSLQSYENPLQLYTQAWKGSCLCGSVDISISGLPIITYICHCNDCKRIFGSDFVTLARFKTEHVQILNQRNVLWCHVNDVAHFFCEHCGTTFELKGPASPTETTIPIALLDSGNINLAPNIEIYCAQQALWLPALAPPYLRYDYAPSPFTSHVHWQVPEDIL
ncbi:Mss4-like protein [Annulohypoxylon moriforme]|nr:Mss4-like protein [Annulohypoxylon moriforme]